MKILSEVTKKLTSFYNSVSGQFKKTQVDSSSINEKNIITREKCSKFEKNKSLILIDRMQRNWQNYILSLMFGSGVFIIPLISDYWYNGYVTEKTLTLSLAMYIISVSTMTKEIVVFGLSFITTTMLLVHYGAIKDNPTINLDSPIMFIFYSVLFLYSIERFFRHIIDKEEYWDFFKFKA